MLSRPLIVLLILMLSAGAFLGAQCAYGIGQPWEAAGATLGVAAMYLCFRLGTMDRHE